MAELSEDRLERLELRQTDLLVQVTKNTAQLEELHHDVAAVVAELGGAPIFMARGARQTIRWRLHQLETDQAAARLAAQALKEASEANRQAWSRREKMFLFVFAFIASLEGVLRMLHYLT